MRFRVTVVGRCGFRKSRALHEVRARDRRLANNEKPAYAGLSVG